MTIFLDGLLAFTETTGRRRKRSVVAAQAGPAMYGALTSRICVIQCRLQYVSLRNLALDIE